MWKNKFIALALTILLSSCGADLNKLAPYAIDHSGAWHDNYYTYFDPALKDVETNKVTLDKDTNKVFVTYNDPNFKAVEKDQATLDYYHDFLLEGYGPQKRLSNYIDEVKDGFISKLFDGQLFCHGYYELARVQINEEGFSSSFYRPIKNASYLYLNFKSALDFKTYHPGSHDDIITIHITLYGDKATTYSYQLNDVPTNAGETYIFYGFSLEGLDISNVKDFAISYTLDYDAGKIEEPSIEHALLLYEFGFGYPNFE